MSEEQTVNKTITQPKPNETPDTDSFAQKTRITTSVLPVEVLGMSEPIEGKIDTGAAQSSMHATEIDVANGQVSFVHGENRYRVAVHQSQDVSSADGGTQSRPVILLNVTINGKNIPEVPVNLNDRGEMPQKFLIGQDIIKAADFVIDLSDEPTDTEPMAPKPEQEEIRGNSIAQLGDNPLADVDSDGDQNTITDEEAANLESIRAQLTKLLACVDRLIQLNQ